MYVHTSGEVDSFNAQLFNFQRCSLYLRAKLDGNLCAIFEVVAKKTLGTFSCGYGVFTSAKEVIFSSAIDCLFVIMSSYVVASRCLCPSRRPSRFVVLFAGRRPMMFALWRKNLPILRLTE